MEDYEYYCGECGLLFGWEDVDPDDVRCPDCDSQDIGGVDELE